MLLSSKHAHSFGVDAEAGPDRPCVTLNLRLKAELQLCSVTSLDPTHSSPSCHFFWPSPEGRFVCRRPRGWTLLTPADWWLGVFLTACSSPRFIAPAENLAVLCSLFRSLSRLSDTRGSFLHLAQVLLLLPPPLISFYTGFELPSVDFRVLWFQVFCMLNVLTNVFSFTFFTYNNCKTHKGFLVKLDLIIDHKYKRQHLMMLFFFFKKAVNYVLKYMLNYQMLLNVVLSCQENMRKSNYIIANLLQQSCIHESVFGCGVMDTCPGFRYVSRASSSEM